MYFLGLYIYHLIYIVKCIHFYPMLNREFYALLLAMLWEREREIKIYRKRKIKIKTKIDKYIKRKKEKDIDKERYITPFWSIYIDHLVFFAKKIKIKFRLSVLHIVQVYGYHLW
jgi:CII-binding regulator of phage lambda lysogenization HflD